MASPVLTGQNSISNVDALQTDGNTVTIDGETYSAVFYAPGGAEGRQDISELHGTVIPPNDTAGLAKNCFFIKDDAAASTSGLYTNIGTNLSCEFSPVESGSGSPVTLPSGQIFYGVANVATPKTLGATFAGAPDTTSSDSAGTPAGTNSAPALTLGGSPLVATLSGFTGTTAGNTTTVTAGGAIVGANALAGATITDGTVETTVISNSALTATTGTIVTVLPLGATITATGSAYQKTGTVAAPIFSGSALGGHTHTVTPTGTVTPTYT